SRDSTAHRSCSRIPIPSPRRNPSTSTSSSLGSGPNTASRSIGWRRTDSLVDRGAAQQGIAADERRRYVGGQGEAMGYDVHITRADDWTEAESTPITLDEWLTYVHSDSEMRLDGYAEAPLPDGRAFRVESPGLSVWTGYSQDGQNSNHAWFHWTGGLVVVK